MGEDFTAMSDTAHRRPQADGHVLSGRQALLNSMSLYDNVALPARTYEAQGIHHRDHDPDRSRSSGSRGTRITSLPAERRHEETAGIARAMAMDPEMIFYDEPSRSSLDPIVAVAWTCLSGRCRIHSI